MSAMTSNTSSVRDMYDATAESYSKIMDAEIVSPLRGEGGSLGSDREGPRSRERAGHAILSGGLSESRIAS